MALARLMSLPQMKKHGGRTSQGPSTMTKFPSVREARVAAMIRKAFANAWAGERPVTEAVAMANQSIRQAYPEMSEAEISSAIKTVRGITN